MASHLFGVVALKGRGARAVHVDAAEHGPQYEDQPCCLAKHCDPENLTNLRKKHDNYVDDDIEVGI